MLHNIQPSFERKSTISSFSPNIARWYPMDRNLWIVSLNPFASITCPTYILSTMLRMLLLVLLLLFIIMNIVFNLMMIDLWESKIPYSTDER